jgi:hypothetical protein
MIEIQWITIIGAAFGLSGSTKYVIDTIRGKAQPNRVSWLIWAMAPMIGVAAQIASGVTWVYLPVLAAGVGPLLVFLASFFNKKAYWKLGKLDYVCGIFAALALILWVITDEPILALTFALICDIVAAVPTYVKAWKQPETESGVAYLIAMFGHVTSFIAMTSWTFVASSFSIYLFSLNASLALIIYRRSIIKILKKGLNICKKNE